jgi:hypothetical protein
MALEWLTTTPQPARMVTESTCMRISARRKTCRTRQATATLSAIKRDKLADEEIETGAFPETGDWPERAKGIPHCWQKVLWLGYNNTQQGQ